MVEEIIVTGSFIRRSEGFTQASAVTQINAGDLADEGTMNLGEVIQNLSFVGGPASSITNTIQGTSSRSTNIDLRGLGARSTLVLVDGKRIADANVNLLLPTIAISRIDIVADGAAALYGSEAVAGVVNFVPYNSYDGLKLEAYSEQDSKRTFEDHSMQALWGGSIGDLKVVLAGQFKTNTRLGWDERPELAQAGMNYSSNAPGNWVVPNRNAAGQYTGTTTNRPDPNCAPASQRQSYIKGENNNPFGMLVGSTATGTCYFDYGDTRDYRSPLDNNSLFANATWDVSDDLTLSLQGFNSRLYQTSYTSTSNPGNSRIGELPAVRGEIPGNPFRAVNSAGQPLYGIDANGDGLPDRGTVDLNRDGTPDYIVTGTTANGVPLFEDVRPRTLRPINKTHLMANGFTPDGDNISGSVDRNSRYSLQADFKVPMLEGWEGFAAYSHSSRRFGFMATQEYDIEAMKQGLRCDPIRDRDACYNPFFVTDQKNQNSPQVIEAIAARRRAFQSNELSVIDVVINGSLGFDLPGGNVGAAVGYQRRDDSYMNTPSETAIRGATWIGSPIRESVTSGSRVVDSLFAEFALPVLDNLEIEAAVRVEDFSTGQRSTDPKIGFTWAATDWMSIRGTTGDAFIAPSLTQLLNPVSCALSTVSDRFSAFSAFTTFCAGGNPALQNETSTSNQLGADFAFGDLTFSVTWNETDFTNRIVGINGQQIMNAEFAAFQAWSGFTGNGVGAANRPSMAQLQSWLASGLSNPDIIRDKNDLGTILQVNSPGSVNAQSIKVSAWDVQANYNYNLRNWGDLRFNLQATNMREFLYADSTTAVPRDAVGSTALQTATAPAVPEWKANLRMGWVRGQHAVTGTVRYVSAVDYDGTRYPIIDSFANTNRVPTAELTEIRAWTDFDLSYTYRGLRMFDGEMGFTLGARNLFDRQAQWTDDFAGVMGELQDPMGRSIYARMVYDF
ncbi:MAG: TonB-dependent receptor [Pseudohongiella sp.]|nr:TonB-dependent receptor [Pseudohongiella sp.]